MYSIASLAVRKAFIHSLCRDKEISVEGAMGRSYSGERSGEDVEVGFERRASVPYFVFWFLHVPSHCRLLSGLSFSFQPPWAVSASLSTIWACMHVKCSAGQASSSLLIGFCDLPAPRTHRHKRLTGEVRSPALAVGVCYHDSCGAWERSHLEGFFCSCRGWFHIKMHQWVRGPFITDAGETPFLTAQTFRDGA